MPTPNIYVDKRKRPGEGSNHYVLHLEIQTFDG